MEQKEKGDRAASHEQELIGQVEAKEKRKMRARSRADRGTWFGLGMMGMIGWSVAVPTLLGVALGYWIDSRWPSCVPWTLILLVLGLGLGCFNAWHWLMREQGEISREREEEDSG
jgi:ATP synthase protein I